MNSSVSIPACHTVRIPKPPYCDNSDDFILWTRRFKENLLLFKFCLPVLPAHTPCNCSEQLPQNLDTNLLVSHDNHCNLLRDAPEAAPPKTFAARKPITAISVCWNYLPVHKKFCHSKNTLNHI